MKKRYKILISLAILIVLLIFAFRYRVSIKQPTISDTSILKEQRIKLKDNFYLLDDSWLKKNKYGLWELYVSGNAFELGAKNGILTKELADYQEEAFVESLREMIPSDFYINFLKYFIAWFNRDIDKYIPLEYQKEIYGVSLSASPKYNFVAPNYQRILNYHAAHDIGHVIQNMNMVACTAFGVKNNRSSDSTIVIGRNMDFYVGDKFAENKIVAFYKPDKGYPFAYITWAGMIGVISGMNNQGLTITLNSAKSDIPTSAKMPVSILAREILQYASTIQEAFEIAKKHQTFVAEAFLVSSAKDNDFAIIEKSTDTTVLFHQDKNEIILTNHFQDKAFDNRKLTIENKKETETVYRWNRVNTLLNQKEKQDVKSIVKILRNQKGKNNEDIGMGNEMAINQLIAHHSVVFKPKQLQMWISVGPYQLGKYIAYDLNKIFSDSLDYKKEIFTETLSIPADSFLYSKAYKNFVEYKKITKLFNKVLKNNVSVNIPEEDIKQYIKLNPNYYYPYFIIGKYYKNMGNAKKAMEYYNASLTKKIAKKAERDLIKSKIDEINSDND